MIRVDADEEGVVFGVGADELDGWEDTGEFVGCGEGGGAGAGGLAADVEEGDLVVEEGLEGWEQGVWGEGRVVEAVVGEGVGGEVEDGHEVGFTGGEGGG